MPRKPRGDAPSLDVQDQDNADGTSKNTTLRHRSSDLQKWELTPDYQRKKIELEVMTTEITGFIPKPGQTRMAMALALGHDVTCVAATGFGKSLAFQMSVFMMRKRNESRRIHQFGICIAPIEALGDDQVAKCSRMGINAVNLSERVVHMNPFIYADIIRGEYELVYLAPEKLMQADSPFHKLLKASKGKNTELIAFVISDECHLVEDWGNDFRTDFAKLDTFRYQIPGVPFGACTATATPDKLRRIRTGLGIPENAISIIEPINRKNLFYAALPIKGGAQMAEHVLTWLIPPCLEKGRHWDEREIPPTIIYVDHKPSAHKLAYFLQGLLPPITHNRPIPENRWDFDPRSRSERVITPYHATLSSTMKQYIQTDWRSGKTRILIATSAWGMGIDDPHVQRVIQWKARTLSLDTLMQRFGRCARDPQIQGLCVLYYEKDCQGDRTVLGQGHIQNKRTHDGHIKITANQKRGNMDAGLYRYINPPATVKANGVAGQIGCRRQVILGYYADQQYSHESVYTTKCCDLCGVDEFNRSEPQLLQGVDTLLPKPKQSRLPNAPLELNRRITSCLIMCTQRIMMQEFPYSSIMLRTHIMATKQIERIASKSPTVAATGDLFSVPGLILDPIIAKYATAICCKIIEIVTEYNIGMQEQQRLHQREGVNSGRTKSTLAISRSSNIISEASVINSTIATNQLSYAVSQPSSLTLTTALSAVPSESHTLTTVDNMATPSSTTSFANAILADTTSLQTTEQKLHLDYSKVTVKALQQMLRNRKLPVSAPRKEELIDRLVKADLIDIQQNNTGIGLENTPETLRRSNSKNPNSLSIPSLRRIRLTTPSAGSDHYPTSTSYHINASSTPPKLQDITNDITNIPQTPQRYGNIQWKPPATPHRPLATPRRPPATPHRPPATPRRPPATPRRSRQNHSIAELPKSNSHEATRISTILQE
ncbi:P-loop containing nucleoside triphosphate hydrolase protein [Terfezia boudieri ATCC MYA-4762]|uniref:DNA 3'-5' helicase n=1 Tax=Terfezia boudieri ATCC MYA-4762 TaxID=1051890 RepID=A0A3N4LDX0_9PEZI|nr:P-loop containing nucleoside triphosphate hydrolase protein [Terfezia boudieri ATCC MYA-4762]